MQTKESIASPTRKASKAMAAIQTEITLLAIDATTSKNQKALAKLAAIRACLRAAQNELESLSTGT